MYIVSEVKFCRCQFVDANLETKIHRQRFADRAMGIAETTNLMRISGLCVADRCSYLAFVVLIGVDFHFRLVHLFGSCAILCSLADKCELKQG